MCGDHTRSGLAGGQRGQTGRRLLGVAGTHGREQPVTGAVVVEGVSHLLKISTNTGPAEPAGQHLGGRGDACRALAGDHQCAQSTGTCLGGLRPSGRLFEDHMSVGAPESERRHTDPARPAVVGPIHLFGNDFQTQALEWDMRVRVLVARGRRNGAVLQGENGLGQSSHTGGGLQVAEVGLHRPDQQRGFGGPPAAQHGAERPGFDGITEQRPRAVRLNVIDLAHVDVGVGVGRPQHRHLRGGIRRHQPVGPTVLIDRGPAHHREHPVVVAQRVAQPLEHHHPGALAADETVCLSVE